MVIRWPGVIKPGSVINDMCSHEDLIPTFAAAAGDADVVAKCLKGHQAAGKTFKVHLDGHNLLTFFKGDEKASPRNDFVYWNDDGLLCAIWVRDIKLHFLIQEAKGGQAVWEREFTNLRIPKVFPAQRSVRVGR